MGPGYVNVGTDEQYPMSERSPTQPERTTSVGLRVLLLNRRVVGPVYVLFLQCQLSESGRRETGEIRRPTKVLRFYVSFLSKKSEGGGWLYSSSYLGSPVV